MITLSDLTDFPSEGNSQGEILGFQVNIFRRGILYTGSIAEK
jgi:hypothetical protein